MIEIFYSKMCGACHQAMDYFDSKGLTYQSYEVTWQGEELADSETARDLLSRFPQVNTVPQIFINDKHIGGWKDLSALIDSGEIDNFC